ncbi:MAG: hypothetical protein JWN04_3909, partial [Myxococcaceae bacterium]|nr:hypothetical protein [Myxococcaceae bacterium]
MSKLHGLLTTLVMALGMACGDEPSASEGAVDREDSQVLEAQGLGEVGGVGSLTARRASGETMLVELESVNVRALQRGDLAEVEVEQVFRSDADSVLEGTFRFPLPERAIMTGLSMWVDGKEMHGELVEHEKARKVFEQIVDAMQDPALLEWEHGNTFKMRVFPIAPHDKKTLTLRYLVPLHRSARGLSFVHAIKASGALPLRHVRVSWSGKPVLEEQDLMVDRKVQVNAAPVAAVLGEQRGDASYRVARVSPDWSKLPRDTRAPAKNWVVIADTSRSALEERALILQSLRTSITDLPAGSRFVVATSDLELRVDPHGFSPVNATTVQNALTFVESLGSDGATDIEAALVGAGALVRELRDAAVLYIGDCEPTWGELRADKLGERAEQLLGDVPLHVVLLGGHPGVEAAVLVDRTSGRLLRAHNAQQVKAFARSLSRPSRQLREVALSVDGETVIADEGRTSLEFGDALTVALKTERGKPAPKTLHVQGKTAGKLVRFDVPLDAVDAPFVAQRFGALWVQTLQRSERPKDEIVRASLHYQVMSKYTSFLVLESEEAYAQYDIARRAPEPAQAPRITGGDLESASADGATINLNRIQPGDPEIYVHAPVDAESVEVSFPFGEPKQARYDREAEGGRGAWMVRFLVPLATHEGTYQATARVVHRDGRVESLTVSYTVDRTAPELMVRVRRLRAHP